MSLLWVLHCAGWWTMEASDGVSTASYAICWGLVQKNKKRERETLYSKSFKDFKAGEQSINLSAEPWEENQSYAGISCFEVSPGDRHETKPHASGFVLGQAQDVL